MTKIKIYEIYNKIKNFAKDKRKKIIPAVNKVKGNVLIKLTEVVFINKKLFNIVKKNIYKKKKYIPTFIAASVIFSTMGISVCAMYYSGVDVKENIDTTVADVIETTPVTTSYVAVTSTTVSTTTTVTTTSIKKKETTTVGTTTTSKTTKEFLAFNEDSKRVHRSSCKYYDESMTRIKGSVIEVEARPCEVCNPEIEFANPYYEEPEEVDSYTYSEDYYEYSENEYDNDSSNSESTNQTNNNGSIPYIYDCPFSEDLKNHIYNLSCSYGIPYELVMAIIKQESNFQSDAYNPSGCVGLMQVNSYYNGDVNLYDPYANTSRGMEILSRCYYKAGGDIEWAYTYYHFGEYYTGYDISPYAYKILNYYYEYLN